AVTAMERQCRCAVMAAAISTRCMTRPPRILPKTLASCGSTTSVISVREAPTGLPTKSCETLLPALLGTFPPCVPLFLRVKFYFQHRFFRPARFCGLHPDFAASTMTAYNTRLRAPAQLNL